jgi:CheY-like chemotaxis protein
MEPVDVSILIVDDDKDVCRLLYKLMQKESFHPITVNDGKAALAAVGSVSPDVMLLDMKMPGMEGSEVLARVKEMDQELPGSAANMQETFRNSHSEVTGKINGDVEAFVFNLKDDVSEMQSKFLQYRMVTAKRTNEHLSEFIKELREYVSELVDAVADLKKDFRKDHASMTENLKDYLEGFLMHLGSDVAEVRQAAVDMKEDFTRQHVDMAKGLREELRIFVANLKNYVSWMKHGFNEERAGTTLKLRDQLKIFLAQSEQYVTDMKNMVFRMRQEFRIDIVTARQAWSGVSPAGGGIMKERNEQPGPILDDLTLIWGIGPARHKLLNEAGFSTFEQLSQITPEQLESILGKSITIAELKKWIEQVKL